MSRYKNKSILFDLKQDHGERINLSAEHPEEVERLTELIKEWDKGNRRPLWLDPHGANVAKEEAARQQAIQNALPKTNR